MLFILDGMFMDNNIIVILDVDFNMINYIEVGEFNVDIYVYFKFNKFEFNMLNDIYFFILFGEELVVVDMVIIIDVLFINIFFLVCSDYVYY